MQFLNQSAFLHALGWSLLESLWQMGCLWLVFQVLSRILAARLPRLRHRMAFLALLAGTFWFAFDVYNHYMFLNWPGRTAALASSAIPGYQILVAFLHQALPFLSSLYLMAVLGLMIKLYRQYRYTHQLTRTGLQKLNGELRIFVQTIAERMGIRRPVQAWISDLVDTPLTIGFWKPVILLPVALVNQLSLKQAEAIILHELQHIRRNDFLVNLVIAFSDILLFFNPFARLFSDQLRKEREHICDDAVLQFRYNAEAYARALLTLEKSRLRQPVLAVAANGHNDQLLLHRVRRMLLQEKPADRISVRLFGFLFLALVIGSVGWLRPAKTDSVKPGLEEIVVTGHKISSPAGSPESREASVVPARRSGAIGQTEDLNTVRLSRPGRATVHEKPSPTKENSHESDHQALDLYAYSPAASETAPMVWQVNENEETANAGLSSPAGLYRFATAEVAENDYSFRETRAPRAEGSAGSQPYVPAVSFYFAPLADTSMPAIYIENQQQAVERVIEEQALQTLMNINWSKVERELDGKNLSQAELQAAVKKAMEDVNWTEVNRQVESRLKEAALAARKNYLAALAQYRQFQQTQQWQNQQVQIGQRSAITTGSLNHSGASPEQQQNRDTRKKKGKKIVVI